MLVESDCQYVVTKLHGQQASLSPLGNILQDIKELNGHLQTCSVHFAYRKSNEVGHLLAKYAWNVTDVVLWNGDAPDFLF